MKGIFIFLLTFGLIIVLVFGILLYRHKKKQIINHERMDVLRECRKNRAIIKQYLYLYKNDVENKLLGRIIGYYIKDDSNVYIAYESPHLDIFKGKKEDFINLFDKKKIQYHEPNIKLRGMALSPEKNGFFELLESLNHKDIHLTDEYKYSFEEMLDDYKNMSQKSIDMSPFHQKRLEANAMFTDSETHNGNIQTGQDQGDSE